MTSLIGKAQGFVEDTNQLFSALEIDSTNIDLVSKIAESIGTLIQQNIILVPSTPKYILVNPNKFKEKLLKEEVQKYSQSNKLYKEISITVRPSSF